MKKYLFLIACITAIPCISQACCSQKAVQEEPGRVVFTVGATPQATAVLQKSVAIKNTLHASQIGSSALPKLPTDTLLIGGKKFIIRNKGAGWYGADGEDGKRYIIQTDGNGSIIANQNEKHDEFTV